jgi:uncharacterized DUF497 family protein
MAASMNFEWDPAKSQRNGQAYGEVRVRTIGAVGVAIRHCVYTPRGKARRIITLRYANRKERDAYRAT